MPEGHGDERDLISSLVGDRADSWDIAEVLPEAVLTELGSRGLLCAEVPVKYGGLGFGSLRGGELTAYVGSLCSSLRSVLTSHGTAAWTILRLGDQRQRAALLPQLAAGRITAVAFSEPAAGSDLSAMEVEIRLDHRNAVIDGRKTWVTAAEYADLLVVFGRCGDGSGAVVVPVTAPGLSIERIVHPLGCRAAGHAHVQLDSVAVPAENVLGGSGLPLSLMVTTALAFGRISVAWGCVGILRACLDTAAGHARRRRQFGKPISEHQLVAQHVAEIFMAEQVATRACEHASRCWDAGSPELVVATVLAKHVSAIQAVRGASSAIQVLASAGARDGHVAARAYRDARLMGIIEGSHEICQLLLAQHAMSTYS